MMRTYQEMLTFPTYEEREQYLKLNGVVGDETFGVDRIFNQQFYRSVDWMNIRNFVITRDFGCNLACKDYPIIGKILVHHINPITMDDIRHSSDLLLDPNFLVCVDLSTHNYIHYGKKIIENMIPKERGPNDTCPWKKIGEST